MISLICCSIFVSNTKADYLGLILELDYGLPSFVGREFDIQLTCFDNSPFDVTIRCMFDSQGFSEPLVVFEQSKDYFVNDWITISTSGDWGELLSGPQYNFTIQALDYLNNSKTINQMMEVDRTPPIINSLTLGIEAKDNIVTLQYGQSLSITWICTDDNFAFVRILADGEQKGKDHTDNEGTDSIAFTLPVGSHEKTFKIDFVAYDTAGNSFAESFSVRYIDTREFPTGVGDDFGQKILYGGFVGAGLYIGSSIFVLIIISKTFKIKGFGGEAD